MYDSIKLNGAQTNAYIVSQRESLELIQDSELHEFSEISDENGAIVKPRWELNTVMLASYQNKDTLLSASSYSVSDLISGYKVFREDNGVLYYIKDTGNSTKTIIDFNTKANTKLSFYIYPKTKNENGDTVLSAPIISDYITPQWDGWSVIGLNKIGKNEYTVDTDNIWNFQLNIDSGSIGDNVNRQLHETYSRFPKIMYGRRRYKEGSLKCLLGNISNSDCEYHDSPALMDKWDDFINNGEVKLLKTTKGQVYIVDIYDSKFDTMDGFLGESVELSFNYVQVEDSNNVSVYLV